MNNCMYCGRDQKFSERYIVRRATKPKGYPYRWERIGVYCISCHEEECEELHGEDHTLCLLL